MTERVTDRKMNVLADYRYLADGTKSGVTNQNGDGYEYLGSLIYRHTPSGLELESTDFIDGQFKRGDFASFELHVYKPNFIKFPIRMLEIQVPIEHKQFFIELLKY